MGGQYTSSTSNFTHQKRNLTIKSPKHEKTPPKPWENCCPAPVRGATFVLSLLALPPSLSSPREVAQVETLDRKSPLQSTLHKPEYEN